LTKTLAELEMQKASLANQLDSLVATNSKLRDVAHKAAVQMAQS
jgi:hypothetical protein